MTAIRAEVRENDLLRQIEEIQIDVHSLNNQINPIPHPILVFTVVGGPQVIFADDDGMDLDANVVAVPKAEEPLQAEQWLNTLEHMFCLLRLTEQMKAEYASHQLQGLAGI